MTVRTRFAPSPTGYLHLGGARTALFSWAYAHRHGGRFILRVEDTDQERSTSASTQAILDAMQWLKLDYDEGPFYQMHRLSRYAEVAEQLLREGKAYHCYATREELDVMREAQRARGEKPRYDGRWRDSKATPPAGVDPVIRLRNPTEGGVAWHDEVKGPIEIQNSELDDLILVRADGIPTYNFGVVVDDLDMGITHVIRGDDHVNNTPRQINIFRALGASLPHFGHVPMILGSDGERLSKRHGAVSVMQYFEDGYLPQAMLNYLARLGWSHKDEEVFSIDQFVEWFELESISRSPARFNPEKLLWLNAQYLKEESPEVLRDRVISALAARGCETATGPAIDRVIALLQARVSSLQELADAAVYFYRPVAPSAQLREAHYTAALRPALEDLRQRLGAVEWNKEAISATLKGVAASNGLKMPGLAMPLRVVLTGETQTPSIDATMELLGRSECLERIAIQLEHLPA